MHQNSNSPKAFCAQNCKFLRFLFSDTVDCIYPWALTCKTCFQVTSNVWVSGVKLWSFPAHMWSLTSRHCSKGRCFQSRRKEEIIGKASHFQAICRSKWKNLCRPSFFFFFFLQWLPTFDAVKFLQPQGFLRPNLQIPKISLICLIISIGNLISKRQHEMKKCGLMPRCHEKQSTTHMASDGHKLS